MSNAEPAGQPPTRADVAPRRAVWWSVAIVSVVALGLGALGAGVFRGKAEPEPNRRPRGALVTVAKAEQQSLTLTARHRGELAAEVAELAAQTTGRLESVDVDIGDSVEKGQVLVRIDATQTRRQVSEAEAQVRSAEAAKRRSTAALAGARVELERGKRLVSEKVMSQQEFDTLESRVKVLGAEEEAADAQNGQARARVSVLQQQVRETKLLAPFDGAVAERFLDQGSLVQPGTRVLRIVRRGPLRVRFRAPERDLGRIVRGMPVQVMVQATEAKRFSGKVTRISAEVSRMDRSAAVEAELDAEHEVLRAGMYAEVTLTLGTLDDAVVVPSAALVEREGEQAGQAGVYVIKQEIAHFRPVKVLGSSGDSTAVDGILLGDEVVTLGHDGLRDGSAIRLADPVGK
ncbi:MAG: efflux RND transporter periplasmic adaptor subunit [Myxococcales bacterium]|nr:efflux RND transporter periplasmic adaptor subunit [Myxococcales bacterium]